MSAKGRQGTTPWQTVGPYFSFALTDPWSDRRFAARPGHPGTIALFGHVRDGRGEPVPDAMIETWQADPEGRFDHPDDPRGAVRHPAFRGFARCETDADGRWSVCTLKPGRIPAADGQTLQAPHVTVIVLARGLLKPLYTRAYFADEPDSNAEDPVLSAIPDKARTTLIAEMADASSYRFDIHLQGAHETAFFAI